MSAPEGIRSDVWAAFRSCRLWRTASDEGVARLASSARIEEVGRGAMLAVEGDAAEHLGVVVAGRARVYYMAPDGKQITLETADAGDPIAAVAAMAGSRYPANIDAATPATIAHVERERLFELLEAEPAVARTLVSDLASRVVAFASVVQTLAQDVPNRLAGFLFQRALQVGRPVPGGLRVDLGMKKSELAMALGTVPETLSRAFARLRDEGVVELGGASVTVLDVRALAAMAGGLEES